MHFIVCKVYLNKKLEKNLRQKRKKKHLNGMTDELNNWSNNQEKYYNVAHAQKPSEREKRKKSLVAHSGC